MIEACIVNGCLEVAQRRGLCHRHYQCAYDRVKRGKNTWKQLIDAGLALDCRKARISDFGNILDALPPVEEAVQPMKIDTPWVAPRPAKLPDENEKIRMELANATDPNLERTPPTKVVFPKVICELTEPTLRYEDADGVYEEPVPPWDQE